MSPPVGSQRRLRIAMTGACGQFGRLLLPLLERDASIERIVALDVARPEGAKVDFHRVDLTGHDAPAVLAQALGEAPVDALYHLAFPMGARRERSQAHELEVMGTMSVLAACSRMRVPRLIVPSFTAVYGARREHPALLGEDTPLHGCPASAFVSDKVAVEALVRDWREQQSHARVLVLRFAPILGPGVDMPCTRLLGSRWVPTLLGFDPPWQALHPEDAAVALRLALGADTSGEFNIVGTGVASLSGLIRQAGAQPLPLPAPLARTALRLLRLLGLADLPPALLDYLRYSWVADGARAHHALGFTPRFHVRDAAAALRRS